MLNPRYITARDVIRNYKAVFDKVKKTREPAIVVSQKQPQVVIVSIDDFERMQQQKSTKNLLDLTYKVRGILKDESLPVDLSTNHDYYTWDK